MTRLVPFALCLFAAAPAMAENAAAARLTQARGWVLARCLATAAPDPATKKDAERSAAAILERSDLKPQEFDKLSDLIAPALAAAKPAMSGERLGVLACVDLQASPAVAAALTRPRAKNNRR